ncbi:MULTISPECIES: hypothetical protein [Ramlibacter]|uniref:Uncharacterized protein n=1 Tax=Ramlibacter pinisoli TaxID=2682844 RepID=A0A6N8IPZ4_9BURK|nr:MULTISPECIES: hypothetical protein [Ramlibacter]MBA2960572.1 hypothetical protein [Ramlibacter sp. CGMCC 1.13660]MVQ27903.1 hypothetical protein [Ramlibacter pinisoli]
MRMPHTTWHWFTVAAILVLALFTLSDAHGQSTGPNAAFEGRPAMAGPQSGLGPQAGPPQGGISPQSRDDPGGGVVLQKPSGLDGAAPVVPRDPGVGRPSNSDLARPGGSDVTPPRDRDNGIVKRERDSGGATEQGRSASKAKRAAKRTVERSRHGVGGFDSVGD